MNNKLKKKSLNIKSIHIINNNSLYKREIHNLHTEKISKCSTPPYYNNECDFAHDERYSYNNKSHEYNEYSQGVLDNINSFPQSVTHLLESFNRGGISGKSSISPEVLRRQRAEETRVYGENACQALFRSRQECVVRAWFIKSTIPRFKEALHWMAINRKAYHIVGNEELVKVSGTQHHGGVCLLIKRRSGVTVQQWIERVNDSDCVLALENVSNPHNLGAIMRSCAHFNVRGILLQNVDLIESGAAVRIAEGGAEHIQPITENSILKAIKQFRQAGYTIITTSSHQGLPLFNVTLPKKVVLLLGHENNGLSGSLLSNADISISINGSGNVESLNISTATSILLAEWWRQNRV